MSQDLAQHGLAIALGANLGDPAATLISVRPLLEANLHAWAEASSWFRWSPLFRTEPVGGPAGQPAYMNAVVLIDPLPPAAGDALALLRRLQALEARFARVRHEHWGPRSLDLDLLWCGACRTATAELELPHPRLSQRSFVLAPLAAIDPALVPPDQSAGQHPGAGRSCAELLAALLPRLAEAPPERLPPRPGWPE